MNLGFEYETFSIYQQMALPTIDLLLASVISAFLAAYPLVLIDWESTIPALGWGLRPSLTRKRSRMTRLILSQVPSMHHFLK